MIVQQKPGFRADVAEDSPLAQTVVALSQEVRDLRASARLRAVIEQAKGILVERDNITLDEAFAALRAMSQEHNARLVEVAATIVGVAVPEETDELAGSADGLIHKQLPASKATSPAWMALREQPDIKAGVASALVDSLASSTDRGDQAAELLMDLLRPHGVKALVIFRAGADGSLRLVGQTGVPGDLASSWRSIPPTMSIPFVRSLNEDKTFFWPTRREPTEGFSPEGTLTGRLIADSAAAVIPVRDEYGPLGVIGLMWGVEQVFDDVRQKTITAAVQRVAPILMRNVTEADPEVQWLEAAMRLNLDPWLLLEAIVGQNGVVSDFVVLDAAGVEADITRWTDRRMLEVWPQLASDPTFAALVALMRTGGVWSATVSLASDVPWGTPGSHLRAVRLGGRAALVWRLPAG